jgi:DNA-binding response OmpR family regulator
MTMSGTKTHLNVVLIEDNPGDAQLVKYYLDASGPVHFVDDIELTHVESLDDAEKLDTESYDVLLLDLGLPESTGLDTLDRTTEIVSETPIIVLTGMKDQQKSMEAIQRGAHDYLPKS